MDTGEQSRSGELRLTRQLRAGDLFPGLSATCPRARPPVLFQQTCVQAGTVRTRPKVPFLLLSGALQELEPAWSGTSAPEVWKGRASALNKNKVQAGLPGVGTGRRIPVWGRAAACTIPPLSPDALRCTFPLEGCHQGGLGDTGHLLHAGPGGDGTPLHLQS